MTDATTLRIAIGDYPHTLPLKRGEIVSPWLKLDFVEVKPMHTAFKPMVREHAFDASELALTTCLQAKAFNKGLTLLPAAMLSRFQHGTMLYNSARGTLTPEGPRRQTHRRALLQPDHRRLDPRHPGKRLRRRFLAACSGSPSRTAMSPRRRTRPVSFGRVPTRISRGCCSTASSMPPSMAPPCRTMPGSRAWSPTRMAMPRPGTPNTGWCRSITWWW